MQTVNTGVQAMDLYRFFRSGDEEIVALKGVSIAAAPGELVVVSGPSGAGKSTLLACLAGSDDPDGGKVFIGGERMSHQPETVRAGIRAGRVGLLYQRANLFEHLTVEQNVRFVQRLVVKGLHDDPRALLALVGLERWAEAYPGELSGGELVRVGLAVALCNNPAVLLADEPTGELDSVNELLILDLLLAMAESGTAVVVASHSLDVAAAAHHVVRLVDGAVTG
jgi:putative ABC transport system ATP-binding protein